MYSVETENKKTNFDGMTVDDINSLPMDGEEMIYEAKSLLLVAMRLLDVGAYRFRREGDRSIATDIYRTSDSVKKAIDGITDVQDILDEEGEQK